MVSKAMVYIGIAIGVIGMGAAIAYGTMNQQNYVSEEATMAPASEQGSITSESGLGAELNKERWHEDPFGDIAQKVRENAGVEKKIIKVEETKAEVEETKAEVEEMEVEVEEMEVEEVSESSGPQTVSVDIPTGTAVPGCEETDECFLPSSVTINTGDVVEWTNSDIAAHTVTAGSPADGPSGVFDSSLVLGGTQYAHTFEETGSYDYFCMVHPWMVGIVQVN
ncbi:MAG TPA: plastocyanin/azurin family copper-binding protein [Nitrosopumilaceae archaeon]|nr:plastocyanin/azurin family copper-binding protein [Nitrosopumilaceae archaeon]